MPTEKIKVERAAILARDDTDPILSYEFFAADYGVSLSTFKRYILPELPVIEISDRRRGIRRSDHEARKASRVRKPKRRAA